MVSPTSDMKSEQFACFGFAEPLTTTGLAKYTNGFCCV